MNVSEVYLLGFILQALLSHPSILHRWKNHVKLTFYSAFVLWFETYSLFDVVNYQFISTQGYTCTVLTEFDRDIKWISHIVWKVEHIYVLKTVMVLNARIKIWKQTGILSYFEFGILIFDCRPHVLSNLSYMFD